MSGGVRFSEQINILPDKNNCVRLQFETVNADIKIKNNDIFVFGIQSEIVKLRFIGADIKERTVQPTSDKKDVVHIRILNGEKLKITKKSERDVLINVDYNEEISFELVDCSKNPSHG